MSGGDQLEVKLVRSPIGFSRRKKATVRALGFTRLNQTRRLPDNGAVRGMIAAVSHLLEVAPGGDGDRS